MKEVEFTLSDEDLTGTCPALVAHYYHTMTARDYDKWRVEAIETEKRRMVHNDGVSPEVNYRKRAGEKISAKIKRMAAIRGGK